MPAPFSSDSYQQQLDAQFAEDQRELERQQREAERQQKEQQREQEQAAKEAQRQSNNDKEAAYRAAGRPQYVDAYGDIQPVHSDEEWQRQQQEEQDIAAAHDAAAASGRKFTTSKLTKKPIYLESEQQLQARQQQAAEKLRRSALDDQLAAGKAEFEAAKAQSGVEKLLSDKQKNNLRQQHQEARYALASSLEPQTQEVQGGGDWIPFNESPTEGALKARQNKERLSAPDTTSLSDEDLAGFEANDATKPHVATIRKIQGMLSADEEARKLRQDYARRQADLTLRRDAPDKWEAAQRQKLASLDPAALQEHLDGSGKDLTTRQQELQSAFDAVSARRTQRQGQLAALAAQNEQRRQQGIPAGELVTFRSADGQSTEPWARDLAVQRETLLAQHQQAEADESPELARLTTRADALQKDMDLHNEGLRLAQQKQEEQKQNALSALRFTPGHEQTAQELASLDSEAQQRLADLHEVWGGSPPPAAVEAIHDDVSTRRQSAMVMGDARRLAAQSAYSDLRRFASEPDAKGFPPTAGEVKARRAAIAENLSQVLGAPAQDIDRLIGDVEAHDWSTYQPQHAQPDARPATPLEKMLGIRPGSEKDGGLNEPGRNLLENTLKGAVSAMVGDAAHARYRLLSTGGIVVNPLITDPAEYQRVVQSAQATPEAKAAALRQLPDMRAQYGRDALQTLQQLDNDTRARWEAFHKTQPKDVPLEEQAARYADSLKSDKSLFATLMRKSRMFGLSVVQGLAHDLPGMLLGAGAGLTGSETLMQGAQYLAHRAELYQADKRLHGAEGGNFVERGLLEQLPRVAGSILPAAAGAKIAQAGLSAFASTGMGARFLPSLAALLSKSATPQQALQAITTLTRAGVAGAAVAGGAQTYGSQLSDIYTALRKQDPTLGHAQALSAAQQPAILSAAVTAALSAGLGANGIQRLITRPALARDMFKKQFATQLARLGYVGKEFAKGGVKELAEELPDELFSQYQAAVASHPQDPAAGIKAMAQFFQQLPELALAVGALGGAGEGLHAYQSSPVSTTSPHLLPETQVAAQAAIDNYVSALPPEQQDAVKNRAQIALHIAQGGAMQDLTANERLLNDAGWTTRDSKGVQLPEGKVERLKDYTGPSVFEVDSSGTPRLTPDYRARLESELPAVARALPPADQSPAATPETVTATPAASAPSTSKGNAAPPARSGFASETSGSVQPPSTAVNAGAASLQPPQTSTTVPTPEQSVATFFEDRGMPAAEAQSAAAAVMAHPDMQGKDYTWFIREPVKRTAILDSLGVTGSQNTKEKESRPLRYTAKATAAPAASSPQYPAAKGPSLQEQLDDSIPGTPEHSRLIAALEAARSAASEGSAGTPARSDSSSETSGSGQPPQTTANAAQQPSATANKSAAPFDGPAINRAVRDKEMTDIDAARAVQQHTGATTVQDLTAGIQLHLKWTNYQRALTAAAVALEQKSSSPIPLASADKQAATEGSAGTPDRSGSDSGQPPQTTANAAQQLPQLQTVPKALSKNTAWARARLAALAQIQDPRQKAWARQFLATLEEGFQKHHALYDAIGVGTYARSLLDGQMTAVMDIGGKVTRLFDFGAMLRQFNYLADPREAAIATGIEEDIHAATVRLGIAHPEKYGYEAMVRQWDSLPKALRQTVWDGYHATLHTQSGHVSLPARLSPARRYHLMHEFLRMLVQDRHFQGRITESTDTAPGLLDWVKNLLRDLGSLLRRFVDSLPGSQKQQLRQMVDEIASALRAVEKTSAQNTGRLENLSVLQDPAVAARQWLASSAPASGVLSSKALTHAFDMLPADLKARTFQQWKASQQNATASRASKPDLMRFLISGMIGSRPEALAIESLLTPRPTNLLAKMFARIAELTGETARAKASLDAIRLIHTSTLRAVGGLDGLLFVQGLPAPVQALISSTPPNRIQDVIAALRARELQEAAEGRPLFQGAVPPEVLKELRALAYQRGEAQAAASPDLAASVSSSPGARDQLRQQLLAQQNQPAPEPETETDTSPIETPSGRVADMLAALEDHERQTEAIHQEAAGPEAGEKLRARLRLQQAAGIRARFFLRDRAARELYAAEQARRQDLPKAQAMLSLASGLIGARRPAGAWRTLGWAERRQLALLGIGVDQYPSADAGGYPYSLSRLETAELRMEFSLEGTPERELAVQELEWMRQQPAEFQTGIDETSPAYVERGFPLLKQSALDDLSLSYPHTTALIRPEFEARQSFGLRTDSRTPAPKESAPAEAQPRPSAAETSAQSTPLEQPNLPEGSAVTPDRSGSGQPPQTAAPQLSFPIPLSKRGQVRRSTFPDAESLAAFQFKLDADTIANRRSTSSEVAKAEQRGLALLARLMEDSPLSRAQLEQKLLAYHSAVVQQAEAASAFGTFTPPSFHSFSSGNFVSSALSVGPLPAPLGGDIISGMQSQGIRRLGPPDSSDGWAWYRSLQQDAAASKLKNAEAQRLARAGDVTDAKSRLAWINDNIVSQTSGRSIDEAATELSESQDQSFPVSSGEELGQSILAALDARFRASLDPASSIENQASRQEQQDRATAADFATYAAGSPGQPFTAAELAKDLTPYDEIQIGSEYLTVLETDPSNGQVTLDSSRFGPVTATGSQTLNLTSGPNHLRIGRDVGTPARTSGLPETTANEREALSRALPPGTQRDIFRPSPVESTLKDGTLPAATPQDTAALDEDLRTSIDAGNALDASSPQIADLDLNDDLADSADAWLDGEALGAAQRTRRDATFAPAIQTPLGALERYTWQHKLDDVWDNRAGEYQTKRVSDWDKAVTNAETGRDIVHQFDVRKPDGTVQTVSFESALGSLPPEQKKTTTSTIRALRRLPINEALLQSIRNKQDAFMEAYNQAKSQGWMSAPAPELRDPEFPPLKERGVKQLFIGKTFYRNYEPSESPSPGDIREAKERWAVEQITTPGLTYDERNKLDSLPRIIKKDRTALKSSGVSISENPASSIQHPASSPPLPAAPRTPHPLAFPLSNATLSPDDQLRSPSHILASLFPDAARAASALQSAGDALPNVSQRGKPRPSVGGRPADFARVLDWAKAHRRISAPQGFQLSVAPDLVAAFAAAPSSSKIPGIIAGGEHFVVPSWDGQRLYKFTKPGQFGAQAIDGPAYLERLALSNRVFGDDFRFEGFTRFPGDQDFRAVISQPFHAAADPSRPDATMPEILDFLQSKGWHAFEAYHIHPILGLQLWDIQTPGNLIATPFGPMPVDLQLEPADPARLQRLRAQIQQGPRPPLFAAERLSTEARALPPVTHTFPDGYTLTSPGLQPILPAAVRAYHGTPHKVDKFNMAYIGTGEGAQAYGWGLYFAGNKAVAESYTDAGLEVSPRLRMVWERYDYDRAKTRAALQQAIDQNTNGGKEVWQPILDELNSIQEGNLYTVDLLPDESKFLDWDSNISTATAKKLAKRALFRPFNKPGYLRSDITASDLENMTGRELYQMLGHRLAAKTGYGHKSEVTYFLRDAGIPGIKYLDGNSRADGQGTRNYVIFDDKLVRILEENGRPVEQPAIASASRLPSENPASSIQNPAARLETAAAQTHTLPSLAQKLAGNYPKGKVTLHGLPISIENPRGTERSGRTRSGQEWSITMPHHYGYLLGTKGKDKDHLDVFIGPDPGSQLVVIINQGKQLSEGSASTPARSGSGSGSDSKKQPQQTGALRPFDEHKIMLGFSSPAAALRGYQSSYSPGWQGLQSAVTTTLPALKAWLASGNTQSPVTKQQFQRIEQLLFESSRAEGGTLAAASRVHLTTQDVFSHRLALAKQEILQDIANGTVPASVRSWQDLQDHVDANEYVNDKERPDRLIGPLGKSLGWKTPQYIGFTNRLITAVNDWLKSGPQPPQTPPSVPALPASPRIDTLARGISTALDTTGAALKSTVTTTAKAAIAPVAALGTAAELVGLSKPLAAFGSNNLDKKVAQALIRVAGPKVTTARQAAVAWLNKPDGLSPTAKLIIDQALPNALVPREWLALKHEMDRKSAFGAERANDLIRALSGNPRLSDLAYPPEFATNPLYRTQLFDAMEGRIDLSTLPPAMQQLATRLRQMLRDTGEELVRQGLMNPDTFEELQSTGWMPRYTEDEALATGGSFLAAFKLGIRDLMQQRSTAFHIVDTTRREKDGQFATVNREEGGRRNRWRFRDASTRDAYYSQLIREQALDALQNGGKGLQQMLAPLAPKDRTAMRDQIKSLTFDSLLTPETLSPMLRGIVKQAIEDQKARFAKRDPFTPEKLIKDPVYAVARYVLGQSHNAAVAKLLSATAQHSEWITDVDTQGFQKIPDTARFGPLAGQFVKDDIARQILDLVDVPHAALRFYDGLLRKWKSGKLVWNPGSHIRDAVGNTVFAYLGGSSLWNPGNWPHYRDAIQIIRSGSTEGSAGTPARSGDATTYAELIENGVLGGDAYSGLVKERLKGLLPDTRTIQDHNPGLILRTLMGIGSKFHATHEALSEFRRFPDDFYKIAAYLKAKAQFSEGSADTPVRIQQQAAEHVRKWFPYYDRLGSSGTTRAVGRVVNPFLSFFRESTRILGTAAIERPLALSAALAFPAAITALSGMLLGLSDRDREEVEKDLAGRGKGILGLGGFHPFSMLLPFRSGNGAVQQWDISAVMPFADLLGQKIVPLEESENAFQTFWRQMMSAGPVFGLAYSWASNREAFSGRRIVENDMPASEMAAAYASHALGVMAPPLLPDALHAVGIGKGGALSKAGERQTNKTLQTYDPAQTIIRSVLGLNVKSAVPNLYRQADDFRRSLGLEVQNGYDYGTTLESRLKRALVQALAQDTPSPTAIKGLVARLQERGVPLQTDKQIDSVLKIIDPAEIIGGSREKNLTADAARARFRASLSPESRALYETALSEFQKLKLRAHLLLR